MVKPSTRCRYVRSNRSRTPTWQAVTRAVGGRDHTPALRVQRPDLALALKGGPVHPVQLHEVPGHLHRLIPRGDIDQGVAADDFLALGERSIGHRELVLAGADLEALGRGLEPGRILQDSLLHAFTDKLAHRVIQRLGDGLVAGALRVLDHHQVLHGSISPVLWWRLVLLYLDVERGS